MRSFEGPSDYREFKSNLKDVTKVTVEDKTMAVEWHGWIVVERQEGYRDTLHCEVKGASGVYAFTTHSPAAAIEWWDKRTGDRVHLVPTPLGAYRVYTGTLDSEVGDSGKPEHGLQGEGKRQWRRRIDDKGAEIVE